MDVVAEENQEQYLRIQDQASGQVQVSIEAEVSHCHLLWRSIINVACDEVVTKNLLLLSQNRKN